MTAKLKRSTIYLDPDIHTALRLKAAQTQTTISELVNEAVRQLMEEDRENITCASSHPFPGISGSFHPKMSDAFWTESNLSELTRIRRGGKS
jgi:hypothetical protein